MAMKMEDVGRTIGKAVRGVGEFARLERVLAGLCLLIPVLLIGYDAWTVRPSISDYYSMTESQIFYVPLTIAAMLFVVNGVIKEKHRYNTYLGVMLLGVVLFDKTDWGWLHGTFAVAFFVGNAVVIWLYARNTPQHFRQWFVAVIVIALAGWKPLGWYSLFWAEWLSFAAIAVHYVLDSWGGTRYMAAAR